MTHGQSISSPSGLLNLLYTKLIDFVIDLPEFVAVQYSTIHSKVNRRLLKTGLTQMGKYLLFKGKSTFRPRKVLVQSLISISRSRPRV